MTTVAELLEKPLPKPGRDLVGYAGARTLEALLEALLALEFLGRGYTRNAAGKAFQAWKALVGALLALEKERLDKLLPEEERRWLEKRGILRVPTSRLKQLSQLLEDAGLEGVIHPTNTALNLHEYQYHGPDPDMEASKYRSRREAAKDTLLLIKTIARIVEEKIKPRLEEKHMWTEEHRQALQQLKQKLGHRHS